MCVQDVFVGKPKTQKYNTKIINIFLSKDLFKNELKFKRSIAKAECFERDWTLNEIQNSTKNANLAGYLKKPSGNS